MRRLTDDEQEALREVVATSAPAEIDELAATERVTAHDVKAVEYFLKKRLAAIAPGAEDRGLAELIHFACTSEDINNLSYALMVQGAVHEVWLPRAHRARRAGRRRWPRDLRDVPLLAHTHGQPATPTTMGKELAVLARRLQRQLAPHRGRRVPRQAQRRDRHVRRAPRRGARRRLAGASAARSSRASASRWNPLTTQIESHDWQAELYADVARFNRVLHNLCTDVWTYISLGYFAQVRGQGTVGSSTMPHKVNPIRFENAEANLEVSNALLDVLAATLVQQPPAARPHRLLDAAQHRLGLRPLAARHRQRRARPRRPRRRARRDGRRPRRELGGARRADPVGDARPRRRRASPGMEDPYERLKELTRGRRIGRPTCASSSRGLGLPGRRRGAARRR